MAKQDGKRHLHAGTLKLNWKRPAVVLVKVVKEATQEPQSYRATELQPPKRPPGHAARSGASKSFRNSAKRRRKRLHSWQSPKLGCPSKGPRFVCENQIGLKDRVVCLNQFRLSWISEERERERVEPVLQVSGDPNQIFSDTIPLNVHV